MASLSELQAHREKLVSARFSGVRKVRDQNGESVEYATDRELSDAIAACDREIAGLSGVRSPKTIIFQTSKGL